MPDGSGFDLLAQLDYVPSVIFVTAYDEFALQSLEAMGNYTQIHLSSKKVSVYRTMSHIESRLPSDDFFRAGRSWIINVNQIKTVELEVGGSLEVTLNNQLKVQLSRKQTALFKQKWRL
ncbi:hypothetical protein PA25_31590 [Pseudoalteromonas sp. A25]|uniref:LytR/AlgR family response regulator transcription factor n=1 Tax=Pseudoalteromonas sp. A25 TaxID=116092 RepID=UPI0012603F18|nr:response regulator transcription factor [Pseudoalteromonas sp. A25]BBN83174.1 hypothetical protein PA25_31590 [Pseudoalteromonas sp. A25]